MRKIFLACVIMAGMAAPAVAGQGRYVVKCQMKDGSWPTMSPGIFYSLPEADAWKINYQNSTGLHCQTSSLN